MVPHDEKTKTVVMEPFLTEQWYLNAEPLAAKAIVAVETGETKFVPENWGNVYFSWLRNIKPLVHLAPALVGPPDSGLVRRGWRRSPSLRPKMRRFGRRAAKC
jgi:hypothetical protein